MTDELKNKIEDIVRRGILGWKSSYIITKEIAEVVDIRPIETDAIELALGTLSAFIEVAQNGYDTQFESAYRLELQAARAQLNKIKNP